MNKKYIRILAGIMIATVALLISVQIAWLNNVRIVSEKQFSERVNKTLFEIVKTAEEREALLSITGASGMYAQSQRYKKHRTLLNKLKSPKDPNRTIDSLPDSLLSEKINKNLKGKLNKKIAFIQGIINRMLAGEEKIEKRLEAVDIRKIISERFKQNNLPDNYAFAIRDQSGSYSEKSKNFSLHYIKQTYEIQLFPNDLLASPYFLVVYFQNENQLTPAQLPREVILSLIITAIIILTFIFILYYILRQRKLSELKNDFINNMTHELKTPVSTISLASQMLGDNLIRMDEKRTRQILQMISSESQRLEFQIDKVLQTSLFEKGNIHFNFQTTDIHALILSVVKNTEIKVKNKGGSIQTILNAQSHILSGDKLHLTNIFFNLLDNALKYSRENIAPSIKITSSSNYFQIKIVIEDNGIGISKENQKKIFNKFYRVPTGNLHNTKGFGLGLSYVKRIVEEHKGTIHVKSEQDKGSQFIILFPVIKKNKNP
ncbi:MAG: hypothetical protein CSB06_01610 [Bacteroidia bacterium]|nr:MAG: hypothetical protein CSB06_01610 [Bacteroidia bacterium]